MSSSSSASWQNFYPRPPRGGRPKKALHNADVQIHFYPRPPRGGRRTSANRTGTSSKFLSTPSARRATPHPADPGLQIDISIHALREEGDHYFGGLPGGCCNFYPRPPRGGRPPPVEPKALIHFYFYPRPPRGGRRPRGSRLHDHQRISIHALREEGDFRHPRPDLHLHHFYPRPPRGGRPASSSPTMQPSRFLSTPSARRATTRPVFATMPLRKFLSTPSARRATGTFTRTATAGSDFYPRPPRGGRQNAVSPTPAD